MIKISRQIKSDDLKINVVSDKADNHSGEPAHEELDYVAIDKEIDNDDVKMFETVDKEIGLSNSPSSANASEVVNKNASLEKVK